MIMKIIDFLFIQYKRLWRWISIWQYNWCFGYCEKWNMKNPSKIIYFQSFIVRVPWRPWLARTVNIQYDKWFWIIHFILLSLHIYEQININKDENLYLFLKFYSTFRCSYEFAAFKTRISFIVSAFIIRIRIAFAHAHCNSIWKQNR